MQARYDLSAEKAIIGATFLDQRIMDEFTISAEDFYQPSHEQLWRVLVAEHRQGRPIQPHTIDQALVPNPITGINLVYLHECLSEVTTATVAPHFANIVKGLASLRRIADVGSTLITNSQTSGWDNADQAIDDARATLDQVAASATGIRVRTFADALKDAVDVWSNPQERGTPTGWVDLDWKMNGGWHPGQITIIGARPAVGKSMVAGSAAVANATTGVGFFSLEMRELEVVSRISSAAQNIQLKNLNKGELSESDWDKVATLAGRSVEWPLYVEDNSMLSMAQIRAHVRTWKRRGPLKVVVIDYLQLVRPADRSDSRERQVSRIAEDCKHLAKEFDIHVIALAQVNRQNTQRQDPRPTMSDLRESGGIEAFADNIILLHRDDNSEGEIEFIIAKNRHGETGTINLAWRPHYSSVSSMARE
ncbi:replicative DNA helicase [Glutamicibacter ardleyensis]|uniref:replicative DNA helicase n=1 Tax=Glutamicibacter ardleyensis TaxID=225894 RepID=UPI003FBA6BEE